jgi:hypothetical protein
MKLKTLLSSKTTARIQIVAVAVPGILLLIATWISTLQIPNIQDMIDSEDSTIRELRDKTTNDLVQGLYATDVHTDRRIDFLDVRLERIMVSSRSKREQLLLEGAISKTIEQIKQWDSLFITKDSLPVSTPIPIFNESTSAEHKIIKLDPILSSSRRSAYSRLNEIIGQIHTHESQKNKYVSAMSKRQLWFRVFQMCGLLLLVLAIVLESHKKYYEVDINSKNSEISEPIASSDPGETPGPKS